MLTQIELSIIQSKYCVSPVARIPSIKCQTQTRAAGIGHCMGAPSGNGASARQYKQNENDMLQFEVYYECLTNDLVYLSTNLRSG